MEIVAIASALILVKVLICYTLLQKCKTVQKIKKEIVKISEKMCKETENCVQNTIEMQTNQNNKQNTKSEITVKKNPPEKPPRAFRPLHVKSMEKCDNSKNNSEETILKNNFKIFSNDDYIRPKDYNGGRYCDQCHRFSYEKEAGIQEIIHSNDVLYTSNELQEQIPSYEIDIDSSKSIPQIPELAKILQLRFLVTNSSESRNSQFYSDEIIIKNNETNFMELPKNMYKELGKNIHPLTSTKIQPKNTFFYKLRKYFIAAFRRIKNKCQ
ncbi:hypothetical protein ACFW04_002665 [Cataglyphis niger]